MNNIDKIKILVKEIQNLFFGKKYILIVQETKKAIKKYPGVSIFYNLLGLALSNIGKFNDARIVLEKGYKINPNDLAIINNLANVYKSIFHYEKSEELYKLSISKQKDYFNSYVNYGNLKRDLNKFDDAIKLYKEALLYNKNISAVYYSLSMAYQSLGKFDEAENYANKTIEIEKKYTKADLLISRSKKYISNDIHLKEMQNKLKNVELSVSEKIDLNFALAKAHEDLGDINKSFEYLKEGNKLKRDNVQFDLSVEKKTFDDIKKIFTKVNFRELESQNSNNKKIIFILGMPRSGTTLIEQIISAHSCVYGSGELPYLTTIIKNKFMNDKKLSTQIINKILEDKNKLYEISKQYYSYLNNYQISENYFTDKAPLNFMWIGFIKILFPDAIIIHCKRNSKDNCVSLYKNIFEGGINFCYTEAELAGYYNLYSQLMDFWQKCLPNKFLNVEYEKVVTDPKNEIKKILDYCNLNWEESCLDFSNNKTPIKTASVGQARNSIYSSSLKSFSKYEDYLKDLFRLL